MYGNISKKNNGDIRKKRVPHRKQEKVKKAKKNRKKVKRKEIH